MSGELTFVGLGLAGTRDITLAGLDAVRAAQAVFAEFYTSHLVGVGAAELENALGAKVQVLSRADVEAGSQRVLDEAKRHRVAFLTAGDPMTATTHQDLASRARAQGVRVRLVHGVSIQVAAAGAAGLQSYKFGRTTTLVFPEPRFNPSSPFDVVVENRKRGLHTLVLLDLRAEEGRYMTAAEGAKLLLGFDAERGAGVITPTTPLLGLARVGSPDERIVYAPAQELATLDLGPPLHCLIVPGSLHFHEEKELGRHAPVASS